MTKIISFTNMTFMVLFVMVFIGCKKYENKLYHTAGYIVGFDPCTISNGYRIGYVVISADLKDTLVTYNLSDFIYTMPSSVMLNPIDTLYKIPESYFQNYRSSAYLPKAVRYEFEIKIVYTYATEESKIYNLCNSDINQSDFSSQFMHNQVIIKSISKY